MHFGMVYLAGAIDMAQGIPDWRTEVVNKLNESGWHVYDSAAAFKLSMPGWMHAAEKVKNVNMGALAQSDILLAEYNFNIMHTGTVIEIMESAKLGIPAVIWCDLEHPPLYLMASGNPNLVIVKNLDEAVKLITSGEMLRHASRALVKSSGDAGMRPVENVNLKVKVLNHDFYDGLLPKDDPAVHGSLEPGMVMQGHEVGSPLRRVYGGDAGWDLYVSEDTTIPPGAVVDVPCGIAIEMPPGYWGRVTGRSSTLRNRGLQVQDAVIDNGFAGEIFAQVKSMTHSTVKIAAGERLAQFVFAPIFSDSWNIEIVDALADSPRGARGFGHTGK